MGGLSQIFLGAILQGALYALGAFGLSLSFGVLNILNVSHGDFLMLGGLLGYFAFVRLGINPLLSAVAIAGLGFVAGALYYRVFLAQLIGRRAHQVTTASVMITLGTALAIEDLTSAAWGGGSTGIPYTLPTVVWGGLEWPLLRVLLLVGTLLLAFILHRFLTRSFIGRAIVASAMNPAGALVVGIDIGRIALIAFGLGIALAAGSGVFYATLYSIDPFMGLNLTLKYLAVIVVGGLGSVPGALAGGFIIALAEAFTGYFIGPEWAPVVAFSILIGALLVRPQGLVGQRN